MTVVSPFYIFPNISWWMQVMDANVVLLDSAEHFEKMTSRNRYRIAGANNSILLSVPLADGRNQHVTMRDVRIHNDGRWQIQHWRAIVSTYKRSPYFDHYEDSLKLLFETSYDHLIDLNKAALQWVKRALRLRFELQETEVYTKAYATDILDLRNANEQSATVPKYYQVFEDRIGFLPDLSILDLLFMEGPATVAKLRG